MRDILARSTAPRCPGCGGTHYPAMRGDGARVWCGGAVAEGYDAPDTSSSSAERGAVLEVVEALAGALERSAEALHGLAVEAIDGADPDRAGPLVDHAGYRVAGAARALRMAAAAMRGTDAGTRPAERQADGGYAFLGPVPPIGPLG